MTEEPDYRLIKDNAADSMPDMASELLDDAVRSHCLRIYIKHSENKTAAAAALGINRNTLMSHLKRWGIQ